jgi:hypothetical protein
MMGEFVSINLAFYVSCQSSDFASLGLHIGPGLAIVVQAFMCSPGVLICYPQHNY